MILITTPLGCVVTSESGPIEKIFEFPENHETVAEILFSLSQGHIPDSLSEVSSYDITLADNEVMATHLGCKLIGLEQRQNVFEAIKEDILNKRNYSQDTYTAFVRDVSLKLVERQLTTAASSKDLALSQASNAIDEIDQTINLFTERLVEWYGIHFPELESILKDNVSYCSAIADFGLREDMIDEKIIEVAKDSFGAPMAAEDMAKIQAFASTAKEMASLRQTLNEYVEETAYAVAPNMSTLVGPLITARLISLAGGLKNLSMKPSSTMQMLGAEKALFRHLKTGARPPKHGIIFQHPSVHLAKPWQRGKIARTLAGLLTIAARVDYRSGNMVADELKEKYEKRVADIQAKHKYPARKKTGKRGGRRR